MWNDWTQERISTKQKKKERKKETNLLVSAGMSSLRFPLICILSLHDTPLYLKKRARLTNVSTLWQMGCL